MSDTIKWKESVVLSWEYQEREATLDELWEDWKDHDTSIVKHLIVLAKEKIAEVEKLKEEVKIYKEAMEGTCACDFDGEVCVDECSYHEAISKERDALRDILDDKVDALEDRDEEIEKLEKENEVLREMNGAMNERLTRVREYIIGMYITDESDRKDLLEMLNE